MPTETTHSDRADHVIDLGEMYADGRTARLFAVENLVIARFSEPPGETRAQPMHRLTFESDVFLLAAFRLYLDHVGRVPMRADRGGSTALEC